MKAKLSTLTGVLIPVFLLVSFTSPAAWAQLTVKDNFTGTSTSPNLKWKAFNGACLTAGNGNTDPVPACVGLPYYKETTQVGGTTGTLPDTAGNGALRFTDGYPNYQQNGAIVSTVPFSTNAGLQVTFTTITYGGDSGGAAKDGADGISFFLMDSAQSPGIGAWGGSLGYSCSNTNPPYDGLVGAYLGLGIDEFGNFLNEGDNTSTGYGYQPGRIGLRGAGNTAWAWLNKNYNSWYPSTGLSSSDQKSAVQNTCKTGYFWDYSDPANPTQTSTAVPYNYAKVPGAYKILPSTLQIANEASQKRGDAVPITYKLKITQPTTTQGSLLSLSYSYNGGVYQPVLAGLDITSPGSGIGPLPSNFFFGFAGSTGGSTNVHEIMCFQAAPANVSSSSAGVNTQKTAEINTGTQVYLAYYNPDTWTGQLTSQYLVYDATAKIVKISSTANWDASCVLTGGDCKSTNVTGMSAQGSGSRSILSWDGTQGTPFQWSNLTAAQQNALDAGDASPFNANRLNYLRGDRTNEVNAAGVGLFRARTNVLGDIVDSSPTWVGPPAAPYSASWSDNLYPSATPAENAASQTYPQFASSAATRLNVVYSGANDGLLHAFRSGSYDSSGNYVNNATTPNDGREVLAYMPGAVVQSIHNAIDATLDFPNTKYAHNYFVDGTPSAGDLFYGGKWHTWLVGGLGPGGKAIYAIDVTDPTQFNESNAKNLVIGEWTSTSISCTNVSNCGDNLGNTYGVPLIRRFHNGAWGVVFGNGFGSKNGSAGIYVLTIDPSSQVKTIRYLNTGYGPSKDPAGKNASNGIAFVTPADLDGDHITDYVYAGDIFGNIWRFDLTSSDPSQWAVGSSPLYSTPAGQPITTKVAVAATPAAVGPPRVMVDFGTGGQLTPPTASATATYASGSQYLYGIWDWNMSSWNGLSSSKYATVTPAPSSITLQTQTATVVSTGFRTVSSNPVCWMGSNTCAGGSSSNTQFGWTMKLPDSTKTTNEQVIYSPILTLGSFIVNTTVPASNSPTTCAMSNDTGWTMAINPATGAAFQDSFFADANNKFIVVNGQVVSGIALNATGSPSVVTAQKAPYLVSQTVSGTGTVNPINPPRPSVGKRLTWIQRR